MTASQGVVEIHFRGEWGLVCGDSKWTDVEASVVCRQLGYSGWSFATSSAAFLTGPTNRDSFENRRIWLEHIQCKGHESALAQCRYQPWNFADQRSSCSEGLFVVGVICGKEIEENYCSPIFHFFF